MRVLREAQIYCNAHRPEADAIMVQNSSADLDALLRGGHETFFEPFADPKELQPLVDAAAKYGAIDKRFEAVEVLSPVVRGLRR